MKILGAALQADGEYEVRGYGLKHQKEKRSMYHFAGLDVSVKETSVCIVDDTGRIVLEVKVASEPEALLQVLGNPIYRFKRIGLEAGPLLREQFSILHRRLRAIVRDDEVCRRLMTGPGVGPVVAHLSRYRRCARTLPKLQGGRSGVWTDALQVSVRRDQPNRRDIKARRRDGTGTHLALL